MKIISSQHFIDEAVVEEKKLALADTSEISIPCAYAGEIDGEEYAVQIDGHHTLAAARGLGIAVSFEIVDDCEGLTGEALLDARYMDGDWYDVENSDPAADKFTLIW